MNLRLVAFPYAYGRVSKLKNADIPFSTTAGSRYLPQNGHACPFSKCELGSLYFACTICDRFTKNITLRRFWRKTAWYGFSKLNDGLDFDAMWINKGFALFVPIIIIDFLLDF